MRVLWVSDSPTTPSGFGAVTRAVCGRLARRGHTIEILGWQDHWATSCWDGIPVRPVRWDAFGSDVLLGYLTRFRPDFVVTLADVWWMSFMTDPPLQRGLDELGARWVLYYPVDGVDRDGRLPLAWRAVLRAADMPVAMSRFGVRVAEASGVPSAYLPHGCDLDLFAPPADKAAAKRRLGYEDAFVVLSDARNQPRKLLPRLLEIVGAFARGKRDVILHIHADPHDDAARSDLYSYRLNADVAAVGLRSQVRFTKNFTMTSLGGVPAEELASIYQAADVHLLCSWGEGFGLPNLQAAAAGVVPIAVAYAASEELVAGHGFAVPAESTVTDEFGLCRCLIDRAATVDALERLYLDRVELRERAAQSRRFALGYGWDDVSDGWDALLRSAPPRRSPEWTRTLEWRGGATTRDVTIPDAVAAATADAFGALPGGVTVKVRLNERTQGEVGSLIRKAAFGTGEELSIPVRLAPFFSGAPRAQLGTVLVVPSSLPVARRIKSIFPALSLIPLFGCDNAFWDPLLVALPRFSLVVDLDGSGPDGLDLSCAAAGVPYIGISELWPLVEAPTALLALRRVLTDQGLSEARRVEADSRAREAFGEDTVAALHARIVENRPVAAVARSAVA